MATAAHPHARQLSRLQIPPQGPQQQPFVFGENMPMYSPSLPTAINVGAHNNFSMPHPQFPMQTPMQAQFFPRQPPGAPARPTMHRAHPSVVQLAAAGILPPPGMPMTPLGQVGFPNPMLPPQPFVPRSKRTQSVSTGGPPKAVLGGPQRKVSPLPPPTVAPAAPPPKTKKVIVNLPKETVQEGEEKGLRTSWSRSPLSPSEVPNQDGILPPEVISADPFPSDAWRLSIPPTVDVFLPGKGAWKEMKQKMIEEKLEKLGVEKGSGSSIPHVHAPHARAASISSPADPALLFFKLNKLQQSQNASASGSLAPSPQPSAQNGSPSPSNGLPPRLQNRHGHSMSLAQAPSFYNPTAAFNPFGPSAILGGDQIISRPSPGITATSENAPLHAPQGIVPTNVNSLAPPLSVSRPESRPDFMRGFGLNVTEEEEEPLEEEIQGEREAEVNESAADVTDSAGEDTLEDGVTTAAQSRIHSRHVSKLSAALSLRSVGRINEEAGMSNPSIPTMLPLRERAGEPEVFDTDAVEEWTGSEDMKETSDDESIGEWSNPSDEERARQERLHRRMLRRARQVRRDLEAPRRLPNFPRPPDTILPGHHLDDDVISNPSDEDRRQFLGYDRPQQFSRPDSSHSAKGRPLPPLPHSRTDSAHFSYHDPALAHSREASGSFTSGGFFQRPPSNQSSAPVPTMPRSESLNPLAKPFVFGTRPIASVSAPAVTSTDPPVGHVRAPSLGKPLNVAAPEFVPGGFTFQPPPGVPQLSFPPSSAPASRPLPTPPVAPEPRASQGREKRQRRGSHASYADEESGEEGNDTMSSFKFPPAADGAKLLRHSAPASPPASSAHLNSTAKPFTFSGFASALSFSPESSDLPASLIAHGAALEGDISAADTVKAREPESATELPFPPAAKPKRAPIPLDFTHPASSNTVPAGLFKALVNGDDERTRRSARSRLSSRDIFEHSPRPSLDDLVVPAISRSQGNRRLLTDPGVWDGSGAEEEGVYSPPRRRSAPPRRTSMTESEVSVGPMNVTRRMEMQLYERRLATLLDQKMTVIKKTLEEYKSSAASQGVSSSTESMITEAMSLFRAQLQDTAAKSLDDSQVDARGEFDFEMLRDIIEQSQAESRNAIQRDLEDLFVARNPANEFRKFAEDLSERTMKAVMTATSQVTMHMHTLEKSRGSFAAERENIVRDIVTTLSPHLSTAQADPIDYDALTAQLSQAVKPHISQLIDLASDKRETAGLIVDQLTPILSSMAQNLDADGIVGRLSSEVRKIVAPLDAHEIKEQVSDLVVERLDSRLAVRDRALSPDAVSDRVVESVKGLLLPLSNLQSSVDALIQKGNAASAPAAVDLSGIREEINTALSTLPAQLRAATESMAVAQAEFLKSQQDQLSRDNSASEDVQQMLDGIDEVLDEQKRMVTQNGEFSNFCQAILKHINELPEAIVEATKVLQNAHTDIISRDTSQKDAEEIRHLMSTNSELQVQLAKARGAHGQVRVEKDHLADRLKFIEMERDNFRAKLEETNLAMLQKTTAVQVAESRTAELEAALAQALERIKSADVAEQSSQDRITALEKSVNELTQEKQQLKSQVDRFETSASYAAREQKLLADEISSLRKQNEDLASQQPQMEDIRRTSEQLQSLVALISRESDEETRELKRTRDKFRALEADHATLQRRFKDQETKATNSEKTALAARQSLAQAQQRATEWENRAKDYEEELVATRTKFSDIEQAHSQLDADYSVLKLQIEERDAEERLVKDRESKLRDQIASLEAQLARVRAEADQAKAAASAKPANGITPHSLTTSRVRQNGYIHQSHTPSRPDSRVSTVYGDSRVVTPSAQPTYAPNIRTASPPQPSVWNSIHAPTARRDEPIRLPVTPKAVRPHQYYRSQIPSPTPSNVSAAPTLGDDGWWQ